MRKQAEARVWRAALYIYFLLLKAFQLGNEAITIIIMCGYCPLQLLQVFINIISFSLHKYLTKSAGHHYNHSINEEIEVERV